MKKTAIEQEVLKHNPFESFNPMQEKALSKGLYQKNLVISSPTASGKTVVAELAALNSIINEKKKVIYTCPLRALAWEHYNDFKKKYSKELNIRMAISTGDFDSANKHLQNYDLVFSTYEKLDSLIRHRADWLNSVGLLVVDEIHELDSGRGPTLEMVITKLRTINPGLRTLALSATIPNSREIAKWLEAELVESSYRPVKLREGVFFNHKIIFGKRFEETKPENDSLKELVRDTLELKGKQALVFANTRKRAEAIAGRLSGFVEKRLTASEKMVLASASEKALSALEAPTEQCRRLSQLIKSGVCFHHAGLMNKQRSLVEELFKENRIKVLAATPTLAAGVNLPGFRVLIPSLYRYTSFGQQRISVREYKQLAGRAGRPKYDSSGEAIVLSSSEFEAEELLESYVNGEVEPVGSQLAFEPVLRTHLLAAVAGNLVFDLASLESFFSKTFYACQYKNMKGLFLKLTEILGLLEEMGFIESDEKRIRPTPLGSRVSELYLDPYSADKIIRALKQDRFSGLYYLYMLSDLSEFSPLPSVSKKREPELWEKLQETKQELPIDVDAEMFSDISLLNKFAACLMLEAWLDESSEQRLMKEFGMAPGALHNKLRVADWLVYAAVELAKLLESRLHLAPLSKLRKRLQYGVREELLNLTEVRNIGRVRARKLFNSNIRSVAELKKASLQELAGIISPKIAYSIKKGLSQKVNEKELREMKVAACGGQTSLDQF